MATTPADFAAIKRRHKLSTGPRQHAGPGGGLNGPCYGVVCDLCVADQAALNDRAVLLAEVKELRAALLPFAEEYLKILDNHGDAWRRMSGELHHAWETLGKPPLRCNATPNVTLTADGKQDLTRAVFEE